MRHKSQITMALLLAALFLLPFFAQAQAATTTLCGQFDTVDTANGYVVQNNIWNGASNSQCIQVDTATGAFSVTRANHSLGTSGPPASYPSIFKGCHWGRCSAGSGVPLQVDRLLGVASSWSITTINNGAWNASYDIWLSPHQDSSGGYNGGTEIMIWLDWRRAQPAGSRVATVSLGGASWEVWYTWMGWHYVAYRRTQTTQSVSNLDLLAFINDAAERGYARRSWYLHSVEAGFELWQGGVGLRSNTFSVTISPSGSPTSTVTAARTATPIPTRTLLGTATRTPTRTSTLLHTRTQTPTPTLPASSGACSVSYIVRNDWGSGATVDVTIQNYASAPIQGWTLAWTFPGNQRIREMWNASFTQTGAQVQARNVSWNAIIPGNGGKVKLGFNLTYSGSNSSPVAFTLNGVACQTALPTATGAPTLTRTNTPIIPTATSFSTATRPVGGACEVEYAIYSDWGSGATVGVTIWNNSNVPINGWTLAWNFPNEQQIVQIWSARHVQSGGSVSATNQTWNALIPPGGSVNFGFNLAHTGQNQKPTTFTLNGVGCTVR